MILRKHLILTFLQLIIEKWRNNGVFLPPSQFEGLFLSTEHSDEDIEQNITSN